ncbi:hypothetical protein RchiOBHm_Chr7g0233031 [Rosa chinensis]|uniref:Uncharacterized protein n=1 Tax=Rosa chinensis TaxID=74649 RepID=A0A2P6PG30_ROSCH|nr:hypothetical protein RchiOBHm_Chr7g0233031 [Rosa chinensis]
MKKELVLIGKAVEYCTLNSESLSLLSFYTRLSLMKICRTSVSISILFMGDFCRQTFISEIVLIFILLFMGYFYWRKIRQHKCIYPFSFIIGRISQMVT